MSHVVGADIGFADPPAMAAACAELGLEWCEGATEYAWYSHWVDDSVELFPWERIFGAAEAARLKALPKEARKAFMNGFLGKCSHKIRIPGTSYEVGVIRRPSDGKWALLWDSYAEPGRAVNVAMGGADGARFRQACAEAKTVMEAKRLGFTVRKVAQQAATLGVR